MNADRGGRLTDPRPRTGRCWVRTNVGGNGQVPAPARRWLSWLVDSAATPTALLSASLLQQLWLPLLLQLQGLQCDVHGVSIDGEDLCIVLQGP